MDYDKLGLISDYILKAGAKGEVGEVGDSRGGKGLASLDSFIETWGNVICRYCLLGIMVI